MPETTTTQAILAGDVRTAARLMREYIARAQTYTFLPSSVPAQLPLKWSHVERWILRGIACRTDAAGDSSATPFEVPSDEIALMSAISGYSYESCETAFAVQVGGVAAKKALYYRRAKAAGAIKRRPMRSLMSDDEDGSEESAADGSGADGSGADGSGADGSGAEESGGSGGSRKVPRAVHDAEEEEEAVPVPRGKRQRSV